MLTAIPFVPWRTFGRKLTYVGLVSRTPRHHPPKWGGSLRCREHHRAGVRYRPGAIASVSMSARSSSVQRRRRSPRVTTSTTDRRLIEGVLFRARSVTISSTAYASASLERRKWHDQCGLAQGGAQAVVTREVSRLYFNRTSIAARFARVSAT